MIPKIGLVVALFEAEEGALSSSYAKRWTRMNLGVGNSVMHAPLMGDPKLYLPSEVEHPDLVLTSKWWRKEVEIILFVPGRF